MRILDAQMHCFCANTPEHPWPRVARTNHGPEFTIEQASAVMDWHGVQGAVLVPPGWNGWNNQYSLDAASAQPRRFGVMGHFNPDSPDAEARLRNWRQQPGMLGVRLYVLNPPSTSFLTGARDWFWRIVEDTRLPVMTTAPGNIAGYGPVLERHPRLRLIIDHAGRHPLGPMDEAAWADEAELHALARYPDVSVKVSSLPCFTSEPYPFPGLHRHIRAIYEHFGPQRMLWGSDATRLRGRYDENIRLFTEALDFLSDDDLEWIMWRSTSRACDWDVE